MARGRSSSVPPEVGQALTKLSIIWHRNMIATTASYATDLKGSLQKANVVVQSHTSALERMRIAYAHGTRQRPDGISTYHRLFPLPLSSCARAITSYMKRRSGRCSHPRSVVGMLKTELCCFRASSLMFSGRSVSGSRLRCSASALTRSFVFFRLIDPIAEVVCASTTRCLAAYVR